MGEYKLWEKVDITEKDIKEAQTVPSDFGLSSSHEHYEDIVCKKTWSLGPVFLTRDSNILEESNAHSLKEYLKNDFPELEDDWIVTSANHWACGWAKHISFRIFENDGKTPSMIFKIIKGFFDYLREEYPVWDDNDYSERCFKATLKAIEDSAKYAQLWRKGCELKDNLPEDWVSKCYGWFSENKPECVEDNENLCINEDDMFECLTALEYVNKVEEQLF